MTTTTKPRAVLDTNIIYYLAGVANPSRLRPNWEDLLTQSFSLSLASPTIIEILTKRNLTGKELWTCLDFLYSGRIEDTLQIGYLPFDVRPLEVITRGRDLAALKDLRADALRRKIDCEARFLQFFLLVLVGGFLRVLSEDRLEALSASQQNSLNRQFQAVMEANQEFVLSELEKILNSSSGERNAAKVVEKIFNDLLLAFVRSGLTNYHAIAHGIDFQEVNSCPPELQQQIVTETQNDPLMTQVGTGSPIERLKGKKYRESVNRYCNEVLDDFQAHDTMPPEVLRFFVDRLQHDIISGAKFRKNDVFDMVLAFSVAADDTIFVTNDDDMIVAMKNASPLSFEVCRSLT